MLIKQGYIFFYIFTVVLIFHSEAIAQSSETIRTGRPGQSIGPYSVGQGYLQVQSGYLYADSKPLGGNKSDINDINTIIRYGYTEKLEFSSLIVYQKGLLSNPVSNADGLARLDLGFRLNLNSKSKGWVPAMGFQTRIRLDAVSREFRSSNITPVMVLATQHIITNNISWINNFGINYDKEDTDPNYFWITNFSFSLTKRLGTFFEIYGNKVDGTSGVFYDGGFSYLINKDLQVDIFAGADMNSGVLERLISVGFSWRTQVN